MLDFRNKFGFILGLIFWFSITLLIVMLGVKVYKRYENKRLNKKVQEGMKKFLLNMKNKAEIEVITQMLKEDDYTLELPIYSGVVIKLQHYCIITPAGNSHYVEQKREDLSRLNLQEFLNQMSLFSKECFRVLKKIKFVQS